MQTRRQFIKTAAAGTAAALAAPYLGGMGCGRKKPMNVIFLMSDQHRAMSMGAYGSKDVLTPNLDRFAETCVLFERAYAPFPQCTASRQSMLTGQYPSRHGCRNIAMDTINPDQWTVAHGFRDAGYETVFAGHPHNNLRGFTTDLTYPAYEKTLPAETRQALGGKFFGLSYFDNCRTAGPLHFPAQYEAECENPYTARAAVEFLEKKHDKPFYLYVSFQKPHPPFVVPQRFWDMYDHDALVMPDKDPRQEMSSFWAQHIHTEEEKRNYLHGYYASITWMDHLMGGVLKAVEDGGYFENSLVSYVSDHGEMAGIHGSWEKHNFFEPAVHVPLLMRTPTSTPARVEGIVDLCDLPVTHTDICGVAPGPAYDGKSLRRVLEGDHSACKNFAISEYYQKKTDADGHEDIDASYGRMLVEGDWKCCINGNMIGKNSLYNLKDDPGELTNLWDVPEHTGMRDRMVARLKKDWRREWWPYKSA